MNQSEIWARYTPEQRALRCAAISEGKTKGWETRKLPRGFCKSCGKTLSRPHIKYCCRACLYADPSWRKGPAKLPRKACLTCGKEVSFPRNKYCSRACMVADPRFNEIHVPGLLRGQKKAATPEIRKLAAAKMLNRPQTALRTRKGPTNGRAIAFYLRSPDGVVYRGRNVLHFVRTHKSLFAPEDWAWRVKKRSGTAKRFNHPQCRASKGLSSLFGESKFVRYSWKGWTRIIQ